MNAKQVLLAVCLAAVSCGEAALTVNFGSEVGKVNPKLHSAHYAPPFYRRSFINIDNDLKSLNLYACQLQGGEMVEHQKLARKFYGFQSRKFYDGYCEGYKALIAPMAGDRTIFTDLPKPKGFCESFEFEGVREK